MILQTQSIGRTLNRREIAFWVAGRVGQYKDEGLARSDRLLVCYGNNPEFFIDLLAVWHSGAGLVSINRRLTAFETENLARVARPRFTLVDEKTDSATIAKIIYPATWNGNNHSLTVPVSSRARLDNEALILFTSGFTATPKGRLHTYRSLLAPSIAL